MTAPWTQTFGGKKWDLLQPTPAMVNWSEIATVLCRVPRFAGHTLKPLSVAQHSLHVEHFAAELGGNCRARLFAILHDAHEFVLGDMATPVQDALTRLTRVYNDRLGQPLAADFKTVLSDLKTRTDRAIFAAAGLTPEDVTNFRPLVHEADLIALMSERAEFLSDPPDTWGAALEAVPPRPLPQFVSPIRAKFKARLDSLRDQVRTDNRKRGIKPDWDVV